MKPRTTMADVARAAGVASSTVSRSLRNDPRIGAEVRKRIEGICSELGYRPNPLVSALMANRGRKGTGAIDTVAILTSYPEPDGWKSKDVCRWAYEGISQRAAQLGFRTEVVSLVEFGGDVERLRAALLARGIRGVLLGFSREGETPVSLDASRFCVAGLTSYFGGVPVDRASFHGFYNVQLAMGELHNLGYRHTALVTPEFNNRVSNNTWSGAFLDYQRRLPAGERCEPFIPGTDSYEREFHQWLDRTRPDSLIVYKSSVRELLASRGLSVPEDIGLAYLYRTSDEMGGAAGIDGNMAAVGSAAFDLVVERLNSNATGVPEHPKEVLIKGTWHHGTTVRRVDHSAVQNRSSSAPATKSRRRSAVK